MKKSWLFCKWWVMTDSNCRPPRCKRDALPTELITHFPYEMRMFKLLLIKNQEQNKKKSYKFAGLSKISKKLNNITCLQLP